MFMKIFPQSKAVAVLIDVDQRTNNVNFTMDGNNAQLAGLTSLMHEYHESVCRKASNQSQLTTNYFARKFGKYLSLRKFTTYNVQEMKVTYKIKLGRLIK